SGEDGDFKEYINPDSLQTIQTVYAEPALGAAQFNERYQFLRIGYFTLDNKETYHRLVFNRTVTLKDAWAKEQKKG
ncbi:MAG TPA: glutamine--tRNA ligase, partial [Flavisolibacter sp.]|nr:glutamine--tRNA ligase [Flavisolibacter sp.]